VDLSTFIVAVFCLIDDRIKDRGLRARGPAARLSDSEILTIKSSGEFLSLDTDKAVFDYSRCHYAHLYLACVRRTVCLLTQACALRNLYQSISFS
jgi:hypothetical protein